MTEETDSNTVQKESKVTASILDAFDLLKAAKDDAKLNGGSKIISQLHGSEVRFYNIYHVIPVFNVALLYILNVIAA